MALSTISRDKKLLVSILVIGVLAMVVSWGAVRQTEYRHLKEDALGVAVKWARFLQENLKNLDTSLAGGPVSEGDRRVFEFAGKAGNVFRYKLFGPDGLIVFASRASDIGQTNTYPYFADTVKKGGTYVKIEEDEDFGRERSVVSEAYIPIMKNGRFRGAIEVYVDMTAHAVALRDSSNLFLAGLFVLLLIIGCVCGIFVRRNIRDREHELREVIESREQVSVAEEALREAHGTLEQRIGERTVELKREIVERKRAEKELLAAKELADLANRSKSEFLANMSHELRTPLTAIIGFSEIIREETFGPVGSPRYLGYVKDINSSGQHLLAVINDILDLSKIEAGEAQMCEENVNVSKVIKLCLTLVKERAASAGVDLAREMASDDLPALYADGRHLKQILINLLSNAIKFTPPGGKVSVKCWLDAEDGYAFEVADTGIGIARKDIPKAMAPFRQVDSKLHRKYEGTGLGLPLTKALVELHGGSLDLRSALGVGTTVTVRFPPERTVWDTATGKPAKKSPKARPTQARRTAARTA